MRGIPIAILRSRAVRGGISQLGGVCSGSHQVARRNDLRIALQQVVGTALDHGEDVQNRGDAPNVLSNARQTIPHRGMFLRQGLKAFTYTLEPVDFARNALER